jgi:hypothetical protein
MSPTIAIASVMMPPAPTPWIARKTMSWFKDCAAPESTEPATKVMIAIWKSGLRP